MIRWIYRHMAPRWVKVVAGVKKGPTITGKQIFTEGVEPWRSSLALSFMQSRLESGERKRGPYELPCPCQCILENRMFPRLRVHQDHPNECRCGSEMFRMGLLQPASEAAGIILSRELQSILQSWGFDSPHLEIEASRSMLFSCLNFPTNVKCPPTGATGKELK